MEMEGNGSETCKLKTLTEATEGEKIMSRKRCRGVNQMKKTTTRSSPLLFIGHYLSRSDI